MPLKDLSGKTVYDLELEDFDKLFCSQCSKNKACTKEPRTVDLCKLFVEEGIWDAIYRKRTN